jgi:CRISPR system Cascade subunit CasD
MNWLLFELAGPLASFGGPAPGDIRSTDIVPSRSAILGILAAALGIKKTEPEKQNALADGLKIASRSFYSQEIRDYHTAQSVPQPQLKNRRIRTRRDELSIKSDWGNPVVSQRFYLCDFAATIAINGPAEKLATLAAALTHPKFTLFLGRKSCPPGLPLHPVLIASDSLLDAFSQFDALHDAQLSIIGALALSHTGKRHAYSVDDSERAQLIPLESDTDKIQTLVIWDSPTNTQLRFFSPRQTARIVQRGV